MMTMVPAPEGCADRHKAVVEADQVIAAMECLRQLGADAATWPADVRQTLLKRLDRAVDGLSVVRAAVLVAERAAGTWQGDGDRSPEEWRARTSGAGHLAASRQVRQAEQLQVVPVAVAAVAAGEITMEHASIIARVAAGGTPAQQAAARHPQAQQGLVEAARAQDAGTFARTVARWASTLDPAGSDRDHEVQRAQRYLQVTETPRGAYVRGRLDSMAGRRLTLALEAITPRPAADDDRDPGQRAADALDAMSLAILSAGTKPGANVPPQVTMILTADTWSAARAERDRRRRYHREVSSRRPDAADDAATDAPGGQPLAHPPATLEDGTPVPADELAAAMCDCEITRLVIDADGAPLDLGRSQRLFSGAQRRAVIARDRGCAWPECHAEARWCQVHHVRWWDRDDGPTSVDNGVALCSFHHHEVHRRDLAITRTGLAPPRRASTAGTGPAAPPTEGLPAQWTVPRVDRATYEFRDAAGRVVGGPPRRRDSEPHGRPTTCTSGVVSAAPSSPSGHAGVDGRGSQADEPDLSWVTDPFTGARVPAFFLRS